jgi:hypothetical protein
MFWEFAKRDHEKAANLFRSSAGRPTAALRLAMEYEPRKSREAIADSLLIIATLYDMARWAWLQTDPHPSLAGCGAQRARRAMGRQQTHRENFQPNLCMMERLGPDSLDGEDDGRGPQPRVQAAGRAVGRQQTNRGLSSTEFFSYGRAPRARFS